MKAVVLRGPHDWSVDEVPCPAPGRGEVLVQVVACGICGTDLHTLSGNNTLVRYPTTPGHEFVGVVSEVGDGVTLQRGDRVAIDPSRSCGSCWYCRSGWPNLCPDKGGHGSRVPGGFAEYAVARQESCVRLPDELNWARAMLAEPLACVLHGIDRVGPVLGQRALVYGAGTIGLLAATLLLRSGAQVQLLERVPERRARASAWGLNAAESVDSNEAATGWDIVVDATGVPAAIQEALTRVRRAGTALLLGVAPADARVQISPFLINWHELTIVGSMAVRHSFERAVNLLPSLDLPLEDLVSHEFSLGDFSDAIEMVTSRQGSKIAVIPGAVGPLRAPFTSIRENGDRHD